MTQYYARFPYPPAEDRAAAAREHAIECAEKELLAFSLIYSNLANKTLAKLRAQHIDVPELEDAVEAVEFYMNDGGLLK